MMMVIVCVSREIESGCFRLNIIWFPFEYILVWYNMP